MIIRSVSSRKKLPPPTDDVLHLQYKGCLSQSAQARVAGFEIEIRPQNIWGSKYEILRNGQPKGIIRYSMLETMIVEIEDHHGYFGEWKMKVKGFLNQRFEMTGPEGKLAFTLHPKMNWKTWRYEYRVQAETGTIDQPELLEMLLYAAFGANWYQNMMAGVVTSAT